MVYIDSVNVQCKNKLCDKKVEISRYNGAIIPALLPPCPHCGFNTLDEFAFSIKQLKELSKIGKSNE